MKFHFWNCWLGLGISVVIGAGSLLFAQTSSKSTRRLASKPEPAGMFDLQLGKFYEKQERWKEAEQEYVQAGRIGAPGVKKEALAAIERLKIYRPSDNENFEFDLAKLYEDGEHWQEAEQHYAAAAKGETKQVRDLALQGVQRARAHRGWEEFWGDFDRWLGYLARVLGLLFLVVIAYRLWRVWRTMEIVPFEAGNDNASKQVNFSLASALEGLPQIVGPVVFTGNDVLTKLPGVEGLPDPVQDIEIGGVKLPLTDWIKMIRLPKVRVVGRWDTGMRSAQARIFGRRWIFRYLEKRSSRFYVPAEAGDTQELRLRLFAYDVLIKSIFLRRYGR